MENQKQYDPQDAQQVANLARHQSQCSICTHPERESIEDEWVNWGNTTMISERYKVSRDAVYRHARYRDLYRQRQKNWKGTLEKIIERLDMTPLSGSVILSAIREYAKLDAAEQKAQPRQSEERAGTEAKPQDKPEAELSPSDDAAALTEPPEVEKPSQVTENTTVQ